MSKFVTMVEAEAGGKPLYMFSCPHCDGTVTVCENQVNCTIFRHGVYKSGKRKKQPVSPHTPKAECDRLACEGLIHGCGKPFKFDGKKVTICGYI